MKITYLHQYFNTPNMSGGTRSFEMAKRFVKAGHEVHMITSWREPGFPPSTYEIIHGIHVYWLSVNYTNKMGFIRRILAFLLFALKATFKSISIKSDIVFATSTPLTISIPGVISAKINGSKFIFEVRDLWPELPIAIGAISNPILIYLSKKLERFAYKNSDSIITLSPGMFTGVLNCGYDSNKIAVIPNSSDIENFTVCHTEGLNFRKKRNIHETTPVILYAGTFGIINGVDYLVDLAVELKRINSDIVILAIGGGVKFDGVINYSKTKGVYNHNFLVEPYLNKSEIPKAFSAATLCCGVFVDLPEMRSNSSNKFFDSLAASKPLFINYGGWMHEIINDTGCGISSWNLPLKDTAILLNNFVSNEKALLDASKSSSNLASLYFDRDLLFKKLLSVFELTFNDDAKNVSRVAPSNFYK